VPNGNPAFNLAEQETCFAPLAQAIGGVAGKHNLLLEKYYHEGASWDLRFNHPRGGQASVTIYSCAGGFRVVSGRLRFVFTVYSFTPSASDSKAIRFCPPGDQDRVHGHPRVARRAVDSDREGLRTNLESLLQGGVSGDGSKIA
jgi:hypothetical protein